MLGHCSGPTELQDELLKQHGMELLQSCLAWTLVLIRQHKTLNCLSPRPRELRKPLATAMAEHSYFRAVVSR